MPRYMPGTLSDPEDTAVNKKSDLCLLTADICSSLTGKWRKDVGDQ